MKKIVLKLYEFDELSKDSQERVIERERRDPFNKEYSMDSEEDIRDWYMSYINEMRNKYGGK